MLFIIPIEKNYLEIKNAKFYGEIFQKCIGAPDFKKFKSGRFLFLNSSSNIEYFLEQFPQAEWSAEAELLRDEYFRQKENENELLDGKSQEVVFKDYPEIFKTKPMDHQFKAFELSKDQPYYGLFFEQGCGKTKVVIDTASYLFLQKKITALIIIAPNGVHKNWLTDELPKHCKIEYEAFCWTGSLVKKVKEKLDQVSKSNKLRIFSFNIESFTGPKQQELLKKILSENTCLMALDESQTIKNQKAKRTKFLVDKISKLVSYKRIMTGTPVTKGVEDLYTQLKFLCADIIGISSFYAFRNKYCTMGGFANKKIISYKNLDELQNKIQTYSMRVLKKDCLDLPDKIYQKAPFDMTPEQLKVYEEIRQEGITYIENAKKNGEPITFDNVLSRMKKMQQVALGYLLNIENGAELTEIVPFEKNPRLLKLKDLVENIEGKIIIWTIYTQDINYIKRLFGKEAVVYSGKISTEEKEANKEAFRTDPKIKYLIANTQAMARGHTLTEAETSIYYCNSFDLELRLQSEDRNHRTGTKNNVLYIDLEANKTLDKKIIKSLRGKKKIADMVLQDPDNLFMENETIEMEIKNDEMRQM